MLTQEARVAADEILDKYLDRRSTFAGLPVTLRSVRIERDRELRNTLAQPPICGCGRCGR